ncbi:T9SS type A sorting domain-containing protein [Aquimarina agarivorans]|uniref:T9SS type A sorting domain-containing protein n=1 Tax=Aquimarina agarivorans TaxID=980584 RepID=UPI000248EDC1|nr:T9SS type A sorting domain-containing protein [Aquimarina agarivorans]
MKTNILKTLLIYLIFSGTVFSQVQDSTINDPGDIAFVGYFYNGASGNNEGFSFVFLDDCPAGTTIRFDDDEWTGASFATANGEGQVLWENNTGSLIESGTVITITNPSNNDGFLISASTGVATEDNAGFTLTRDDQIYAYTGTRDAPGIFLSFIGEDDSLSADTATLQNTGLEPGKTAFVVNNGGFYAAGTDCNGMVSACAEMIYDPTNWTLGDFMFPEGIPNSFSNTTESNTLNVTENTFMEQELSLYPNPTSGKVLVTKAETILKLELLNLNGVHLSTVTGINLVDLTKFSSGVYLLKITTASGIKMERICKRD